jgi:hypothetical protein
MRNPSPSSSAAARTRNGRPNNTKDPNPRDASGSAAQPPAATPAAPEPPRAVAVPPTYEEIARRAFEIYQREGCLPGRDFENWLKAEAELTGGGSRRP